MAAMKRSYVYIIAAILIAGLVVTLFMKNGNPFSSQKAKPRSRGKVKETGISEENLRAAIKRGDKFAVGVMSDGCHHCTKFKPSFFEARKQLGGSLKYFDATNARDGKLFDQLGVKGFPSIVMVDKGKRVGEYRGDRSTKDVVSKVGKFLES